MALQAFQMMVEKRKIKVGLALIFYKQHRDFKYVIVQKTSYNWFFLRSVKVSINLRVCHTTFKDAFLLNTSLVG